jgi:hypothetical protein
MKVSVFGNRSISDKEKVVGVFQSWLTSHSAGYNSITFLWGGAEGPSTFVVDDIKAWNEEHQEQRVLQTDVVLFKPWHMVYKKLAESFNPMYFYFRNKQIVENADAVLVFSNGEKDSEVRRVIELCESLDKEFTVVEV